MIVYLIADESYAPCLAVVLCSCMQHTQRQLRFRVLDGGVAPATRAALQDMVQAEAPRCTLEFIPVDAARFAHLPDVGHFSRHTYYRYLIPELDSGVDKALYLDCDILVQGDIGLLYDTPLCGHVLGAVPYRFEQMPPGGAAAGLQQWGQGLKQKLGLPVEHVYFNAGVLLLDCAAMRRAGCTQRLFELTEQKAALLECPDQDALNLLCAELGGYCTLPARWNAVADIDAQLGVHYSSPPALLHFTGGQRMRPWLSLDSPGNDVYWACASRTPFAERMLRERLESELRHQKQTLRTLLEAAVSLRRNHLLRFCLWLSGQGTRHRRLLSSLRALLRTYTSACP